MPGQTGTTSRKRSVRITWTKEKLQALLCLGISVILYGIVTFMPVSDLPVSEDGAILREGYGGEEQQYRLYVEGILEEPVPLTVEVGAKRYTEQEADWLFARIMDGMEERIRGENLSLAEVRSDLVLPAWLDEYGIRLRWSSSDPEILDSSGKIAERAPAGPEGTWIYLSVRMTADSCRQTYEMPVRVLPPPQTEQQKLVEGLQQEIRTREEVQAAEDILLLPDEYAGRKLRYRSAEESGYGALLALGAVMAVLCYAREGAGKKEKEKLRERELLLDYAELLSKLMVLIGAGMTVRSAWERMVADYELAVQAGRQKRRAAYEEMGRTWHQLQSGMPEGAAYREFGKRCRLQPYLKLSSLLEQNRRTGSKNLRNILQTEITDAFEQRKNLARRLGEEAGTKLLLPLFMMLGIVMVMIMVPAMMTMG